MTAKDKIKELERTLAAKLLLIAISSLALTFLQLTVDSAYCRYLTCAWHVLKLNPYRQCPTHHEFSQAKGGPCIHDGVPKIMWVWGPRDAHIYGACKFLWHWTWRSVSIDAAARVDTEAPNVCTPLAGRRSFCCKIFLSNGYEWNCIGPQKGVHTHISHTTHEQPAYIERVHRIK